MKMIKLLCVSLALAVTLVGVAKADAAPDVKSLVAMSEKAAYYAGDDGRSMARMIIVDSQGRKQMRQFTLLRKDVLDESGVETGDQRMLVFSNVLPKLKARCFVWRSMLPCLKTTIGGFIFPRLI